MWNDFKAFIARGNILDLAIAFIMGAAFTSVVKTFTDGIVMPFVGILTGGIDFKDKVFNLGDMPVSTPEQIAAARDAGYGACLSGAGPTVLIIAANDDTAVADRLREAAGEGWRIEPLRWDRAGARSDQPASSAG